LDVSGIGRAAFDLRNDVNEPALADREPSHAVNSAIPSTRAAAHLSNRNLSMLASS
jgi:hypothetical protein